MGAVQFFHEATRMSQKPSDIDDFKVYINDVVVWTELPNGAGNRTKGKPYVVKEVTSYGNVIVINNLGKKVSYGRAHGFKVLATRHFSVKSDVYINKDDNTLSRGGSNMYSIGLLFSNKELKYLNNPARRKILEGKWSGLS